MKRLLFVVLLAVVSCLCHAQDVIVTKDGDRIKCIITSENDASVSYVEWKDKKETLKVLPMSSVWSVTYDEKLRRVTSTLLSSSSSSLQPSSLNDDVAEIFMSGGRVKSHVPAGGVIGLVSGILIMGAGMSTGLLMLEVNNVWGVAPLVGGLVVGSTVVALGGMSIRKAAMAQYTSIVDVPVNDKVSVGLYDYAFAPAQSHGAGVGIKINF